VVLGGALTVTRTRAPLVPGDRTGHNDAVPVTTEPAILDVQAGLGDVKAALLALGATAPEQRSVAFSLDEHLLLLAYDEFEKCTTIAVGGPRAVRTAHWLAHELEGQGRPVGAVLPAVEARPSATARVVGASG
jgi:hypothetical protein